MKIFKWIYNNILFLITLFLLAFIPLYPKKPLLDIVNTWVYIRAEDFVVAFVLLAWIALLVRKKINLKSPLTLPILLFWIVGGISTIHGVLLIFPQLSNVFPNIAFLSMLRRIEYMSLFFVAYAGLKDKKSFPYIIWVIILTLLGVVAYGMGQKYFGFPAYLTMNEEFAKGIPIQLSALSRVPSTFAGHYDLAAYLVFIIPIVVSLIFGYKNWFVRIFLGLVALSSFVLLYFTVSRVSFFVLILMIAVVLFIYKRRWVIFSFPFVAVLLIFLFLNYAPRLVDRFGSTVKEVDVLVNAATGEALGSIKDVLRDDFKDRVVRKKTFLTREDIDAKTTTKQDELQLTNTLTIVPFLKLPVRGVQLVPPNASTGESLSQGTGYINLSLSPVKNQYGEFFYEQKDENATQSAEVQMFTGRFVVKRAAAYDLSLTTRYQGEWPHAIEAFQRNVFLGSGYASISLAVDNSYLRMLGEIGFMGFVAFVSIFVVAGIYIKKVLVDIDSPLVRSFVVGFSVGVVGLALNATLIDVFEASKIAFYLWLLMGITIGILSKYQLKEVNFSLELKKIATSTPAVIVYLGIIVFLLYSPMIKNYFIGDDFTWLRWAADCGSTQCPNILDRVINYFTNADGFFYRPGTKSYFLLMYSIFWLNPVAYHVVSLVLHFIVVSLVFVLVKKVFGDLKLASLSALLFVIISGYSEAVFWIAATGDLFNAVFILLGLIFYINWDEKKNVIYFALSILSISASMLFHELGVIAPLLIILYKLFKGNSNLLTLKSNKLQIILLFIPVVLYLIVRFIARSHWQGGDYSYNLLKLPFNFIGNLFGYSLLSVFGPMALPINELVRSISRQNIIITIIVFSSAFVLAIFLFKFAKKFDIKTKRIITFSVLFAVISLLPFLGLGNITSRYSYLASLGVVILLAIFIRKSYRYLLSSGKHVATLSMAVVMSIFFMLHVMQLQKLHGEWFESGKKVNNFFTSIENLYENEWATDPLQFYFVNTPIRTGDAWIFPVGLNDSLWFLFKNPKIQVLQSNSVEEALSNISDPLTQKVFVFDDSGVVTQKFKKIKIQ